ncbi:hypothetical protein BABINDRAFT_162433 [Babjeviella inositovora NRRL Y-12698]|uniref:Vacuolar protein sorting-associated protein 54 C-terminal domain-containing protein n=1 Tax=Babjeviella inositovora NRRL Y-12698 TaxID=984486 RepID=A0A1E3QM19_9ASCO|nr:uncharacterized protein BABINDRAFT_162433 [Babjeviella inositovora NRRL Y-12698]ODQ78743.1 hypothetical protein BABINDRAFT_162433 [Babjeviella inositovora NRRL Y-12698]
MDDSVSDLNVSASDDNTSLREFPSNPRFSIDSSYVHGNDTYDHGNDTFSPSILTPSVVGSSVDVRSSFEDSTSVLGVNTLSEASVSPLGANSIYELTNGGDKRRTRGNALLKVPATPPVRGPTTKDIPPITLSKITKVKQTDFDDYLADVETAYGKYQSHTRLTESTLQAFIERVEQEEKQKNGVQGETGNIGSIPKVFFEGEFHLDDPRVFELVTEKSQLLANRGYNKDLVANSNAKNTVALTNNNQLQEKLSQYLDTVEIYLIHEISKTSGSFFDAFGDLKVIREDSARSVELAVLVEQRLNILASEEASSALEALTAMRTQRNVAILEQSMVQVSLVLEEADRAESLLTQGFLGECLDKIDHVEALIKGDTQHPAVKTLSGTLPFPLEDLTPLEALTPLKRLLAQLTSSVSNHYRSIFLDLMVSNLREQYEGADANQTLMRMQSQILPADRRPRVLNTLYAELLPEFKLKALEYISGLCRCNEVVPAFKMLNDKYIAEVKTIVRVNLPNDKDAVPSSASATSASTRPNSSSLLPASLRELMPTEYQAMLTLIYTQLSECLRRMAHQQKFVLDVALGALERHPSNTESSMAVDITSTIHACVDILQTRMKKIMTVRTSQTNNVTLPFFARFYALNASFLNECELITGGFNTSNVLQEYLFSQTKSYCAHFHQTNVRAFAESIDRETWKEVTGSEVQAVVDGIVHSGTDGAVPREWLDLYLLYETEAAAETPEAKEMVTRISFDNSRFVIPQTVATLLTYTKQYLLLKTLYPNFTQIFEANVCELIRVFNSKTIQSVLGAGATRTAGLKHISTKHLALASQALDVWLHLIPYAKKAFNKRLESDEWDKLLAALQEHQGEIFNKLVSIMSDRVGTHCVAARSINWSEGLEAPAQCHKYMEVLVKDTVTIARVLQKYLPELQASLILSQVFAVYKRSLLEEYSRVVFKDSIEKAYMMKDVDYFRAKLSDLPGYGNSGQIIWENVNATPTAEDARMEMIMRNNIVSERASFEERAEAEVERLASDKLAAEKAETEKLAAEKAKAERLAAEKVEAEKLAAEKAEADRIGAEKLAAEKLAVEKAGAEKVEAERLAAEKLAAEKAKADRLAAEKAEAERIEAEKLASEKAATERLAAEKVDADRIEAEKAKAEKVAAVKLAAEKAEVEKQAIEKAAAERLAAEKAEADRIEVERLAAEKAEAEKQVAEKAAAVKLAAEKAAAERLAAEKVETDRIEAERLAAEKAEADRIEAEKLVAEKAETEKQAAEKAAAEKVEADRIEAERLAAEKVELEKQATEKAEAERLAAEKAESERLATEKAEADRSEAKKLAAAKLVVEKAEAERLAMEKAEAEKLAAETAEAEGLVAEKLATEKIAAKKLASKAEDKRFADSKAEEERLEAEKFAADKAEAERIQAEYLAAEKLAAEKFAADKAEAEKIEAEYLASQKLAMEKAEAEKLAAEKVETEKLAAEKVEAERLAAEKAETERLAAEKVEAERLAAEKLAAEKEQTERLAAEKAETERLAAEKLAIEKAEAERLVAEKAEVERLATTVAATTNIVKAETENIEPESASDDKSDAENTVTETKAVEKTGSGKLLSKKRKKLKLRKR